MNKTFVPEHEIYSRIKKLQENILNLNLDGALIFEHISLFYYTGTFQDAALFVPVSGEPVFFVRRNIERAKIESPLKEFSAFKSFKELPPYLEKLGYSYNRIGIDESTITLFIFKLLSGHLLKTEFSDISMTLKKIRSVKSEYEIDKMRKAGEISRQINKKIPGLLVPGITEWELNLKLYKEIADSGSNCFGRLSFGSGEILLGNICFGRNSLYPCEFNGPGGMKGKSPANPSAGSDTKLKNGDLVYIDIAYPFEEYYLDKTRVFSLGRPDSRILEAHSICLEIQETVRKRLIPGAVPEEIYREVFSKIVAPNNFEENFMGYKSNQVRFLGHGIGLVVDEYPVIAEKMKDPLQENMVLAIEPKKGIEGTGMVGIENTYLIRKDGPENLTEDNDEIIVV